MTLEDVSPSVESSVPPALARALERDTEPDKKGQSALSAPRRRISGVELSTIAGVGPVIAQTILSEVGSDVEAWATEKHFASWLGLSPNHTISGGRIWGRGTRPVVHRVCQALRMAASPLPHSQSALGAKLRRLKARLGPAKAIVAMARPLACLIYRMIKYGQDYFYFVTFRRSREPAPFQI